MFFLIASVLTVLIVSFLCSLAESVLLSLNVTALRSANGNNKVYQAWVRMKNNIGRPIAAILILNTVANTGGATVAGSAFSDLFGQKWLWLFSAVMTCLILLCTEILPKTIGVAYNRFLAPYLTWPLEHAARLLSPVIWITEFITRRFKPDPQTSQISSSDILTMASMARAGKAIGLEQENIIVNAIRLSHSPVRTAMLPRDSIRYLINGMSLDENEERLGTLAHTRYPLCLCDSVDSVVGTINYKKLRSLHADEEPDFRPMARPAVRIHDDVSLLEALRTMSKNKIHLLLVVDRNDRICGLITMEDITDELVCVEVPE